MTDPTDDPMREDIRQGLGRRDGTPRWVKVTGIVALVLLLLIVVLLLTRGPGGHGPSRHASGEPSAGSLAARQGMTTRLDVDDRTWRWRGHSS
ncbi:MAG: hypothetical protein ACR2JK_17185 [Geodermatophilaceae bacterium]